MGSLHLHTNLKRVLFLFFWGVRIISQIRICSHLCLLSDPICGIWSCDYNETSRVRVHALETMVNATQKPNKRSLAFSVPLDRHPTTCDSNLVRGVRWQPAFPFSQPESQNGTVILGVMEGEAVSGRGGGASAQRDGHVEPDCSFPFCPPLEQRACGDQLE